MNDYINLKYKNNLVHIKLRNLPHILEFSSSPSEQSKNALQTNLLSMHFLSALQ